MNLLGAMVKEPFMPSELVQLKIRLPPDARAFIRAEALENASSQNSEIVRAIRGAMKAKGPAGAATPPSHEHVLPSKGKDNDHSNQ
ncbi:Arc family DNA-binding protein [Devosia geojensis]|uniref:Arc family DNA-binding protein n=1 Tax=Devosia geojensis TaxID=443610 RepID=UPI00128D4ADD